MGLSVQVLPYKPLCCARCTKPVPVDKPLYQKGVYIYGECCVLSVAPEMLEQVVNSA
jgi:hypothetical protein